MSILYIPMILCSGMSMLKYNDTMFRNVYAIIQWYYAYECLCYNTMILCLGMSMLYSKDSIFRNVYAIIKWFYV